MSEWFRHGRHVDSLPIDDRAVQYGDGVFETIAIRDAQPRFWGSHMQRLRDGCDRLDLTMPAENILQRDVELALARTTLNTGFCVAKIIVTAGGGQRGYRRTPPGNANSLVGIFPARRLTRDAYLSGVTTMLTDTRISVQPKLAGIKSLNRLDQVLARSEWDSENILDGLMRDSEDRLICGTMTNVFVVCDNIIRTPSLKRCGVAGIMRRQIIDHLAENKIECLETDIPTAELSKADEVILSNSQIGAVPVRRCDELEWPVGDAGQSIMAMLAYRQVPECGL